MYLFNNMLLLNNVLKDGFLGLFVLINFEYMNRCVKKLF